MTSAFYDYTFEGRTMVTVSALIEKVAQLTNQSATNVKHTEEPGNHAEPAVRNCVSDNEVTDNVLSNSEFSFLVLHF